MTDPGATPGDPAAEATAPAAHFADPRFRRVAAVLIGALVVVGVLQAVFWAALAPGEQFAVYSNGAYLGLPTAENAPFGSVAIFLFTALVVGIVTAAVAWQIRTLRGVWMVLALVAASAIAAVIAHFLGPALVSGVDPATVGAAPGASPDTITLYRMITARPRNGPLIVLIAQPFAAAATYTILAAWSGLADLGGRRATAATQGPPPSGTTPADAVAE